MEISGNRFDAGQTIIGLGNKKPQVRYPKEIGKTAGKDRKWKGWRYQRSIKKRKYCRDRRFLKVNTTWSGSFAADQKRHED